MNDDEGKKTMQTDRSVTYSDEHCSTVRVWINNRCGQRTLDCQSVTVH